MTHIEQGDLFPAPEPQRFGWRVRLAYWLHGLERTSNKRLAQWTATTLRYYVVVTYVGDAPRPEHVRQREAWEIEYTERRRDGMAGRIHLKYVASPRQVVTFLTDLYDADLRSDRT